MSILRRSAPTPLPAQPDCAQVAAVLQAYVDGELGPDDTDKVAEHLSFCERCDIEAGVVEQVVATIRRQAADIEPDRLVRLARFVDDLEDDA